MVQIVTISATTAAYASELLKPSARVSGASAIDTSPRKRARDILDADEEARKALDHVVLQSSLTSFMLNTGEKRHPVMNTRAHVEEEYLENNAESDDADRERTVSDLESEIL